MAKDQRTEINEAIDAADEALFYLDKAYSSLDSAGGWGLVDMFGGGFLSTLMKHRHIDDAQDNVEAARAAIRRFAKELQDVDASAGLNVEVDGFLQFADYFFDGFVADWLVQTKIDKSKHDIKKARQEVEQLRRDLVSARNRLDV